jgi:hypothetical protein
MDGWRERQLPDGTLIVTAPTGHTYTTKPGCVQLFPTLCQPTAHAVGARRRTQRAAQRRPRGDDAQAPTHPSRKPLPAESKPNANSTTNTSPNATDHHRSDMGCWFVKGQGEAAATRVVAAAASLARWV